MSARARRWATWGVAGLTAGAALGLLIGWWLWPLRYADTSPAYLDTDYRDDYVLMIAEAYRVDQDLEAARARLSDINADDPVAPVAEMARQLSERGEAGPALEMLRSLATDMLDASRNP